MNEKPKSIWKKTWQGPRGFLLWFILLTVAAFVLILCIGLASATKPPMMQWVTFSLIYAAGFALVGVLMIAFIHWLCCWRNFKRFLFGLACLATLIALFYAEEDWRGKHAWEKFKREWEAKGEKFDLVSLAPSVVPDDQNFALTPVVASSYETFLDKNGHALWPRNTNVINRLEMSPYGERWLLEWPTNGDWRTARTSDLNVWQQYYRALATKTNAFPVPPRPQTPAADVLLALSKYNSTIEELRQNGQLSYSRFPLEYDKDDPAAMLLPHLAVLKGCAQVLQHRALAELQNGQSDQALADIKLILRLVVAVRTEPVLISHLVRIALMNIALQPVWEGLAEHKWSDAQLAVIDQELSRLDFLADYELAMRGECAGDVGEIEFLRRHRDRHHFDEFSSWGDDIDRAHAILRAVIYYFGPTGWFEQSKLRICRFFVQQYLPLANTNLQTLSPTSVRSAEAAFRAATEHYGQFNFLERLLLPSLGNAAKKFAAGQNSVNLARVAIALERYRLTHGEYPQSLDMLLPQFIAKISHDIINGQPLHYHHTSGGQFILYSVGWNETDDGGEVGFTKGGSMDVNTGDWVWQYPAK
jgi:hypothetical protein